METAQIYTPSNSVQGFPFTTSLTTLTIFLLITATLTGMRGYLIVVLIGIFLVTGDAEHLLMCLLVMCVFLGKYLFRSYRLENFSAIVYSSKFSASFSLLLQGLQKWECYYVWCCPRSLLNCPHFFLFFFPFSFSDFKYCLPGCSSIPLRHLINCWFLLVYFKFLLL